MDNDGFTRVTKHSRRRGNKAASAGFSISALDNPNRMDVAAMEEAVSRLAPSLAGSAFHADLVAKLRPFLAAADSVDGDGGGGSGGGDAGANTGADIDLVVYGVGPFSSSAVSRYQLAEALALHRALPTGGADNPPLLFDPVFSEDEIAAARALGFEVITENEECKRCAVRRTVFFMPHCDLGLYNNLLSTNWGPAELQNVVVVGNSFRAYDEGTISSSVRANASNCVLRLRAAAACEEVSLRCIRDGPAGAAEAAVEAAGGSAVREGGEGGNVCGGGESKAEGGGGGGGSGIGEGGGRATVLSERPPLPLDTDIIWKAFNDTSVHAFPAAAIAGVPAEVWEARPQADFKAKCC